MQPVRQKSLPAVKNVSIAERTCTGIAGSQVRRLTMSSHETRVVKLKSIHFNPNSSERLMPVPHSSDRAVYISASVSAVVKRRSHSTLLSGVNSLRRFLGRDTVLKDSRCRISSLKALFKAMRSTEKVSPARRGPPPADSERIEAAEEEADSALVREEAVPAATAPSTKKRQPGQGGACA